MDRKLGSRELGQKVPPASLGLKVGKGHDQQTSLEYDG